MDETVAESSRQTQQATAAAVSVAANADTKATSSVNLLIKSSNQQYDDQIIESDMLWSVKRLKMQLFMTHPSKPPVLEQKLIYSGQLLNDKLLLKDVLRSYKDVYTQNHIIHLVYTPRSAAYPATKVDASKKLNKQPTNMSAAAATINAASESTLRQRHVATDQQQPQQQQQEQQYANSSAMFIPQLSAAACPPYYGQNVLPFNMQLMATQQNAMHLWMQQVYSQYMDQCARLFSVNGVAATPGSNATAANTAWPTNPYIPFMPQTAFQTGNMSYPVIPMSAFSAGVPAAAQATEPMAAPASVVAAAPAAVAAVDEQPPRPQVNAAAEPRFPLIAQEEVDNRDWLDSFFSITRLAIFLTILYFNSSPMRCLAVLMIASFIYLYHIGVFRFNRERNNNNINRNNNAQAQAPRQEQQQQQPQQEQNTDNDSSSDADDDDDVSETSEEEEAAPLVQAATNNNNSATNDAIDSLAATTEAHTNSMLATVRTFVITFFTSLLPETPAI